MVNCCFIYRRYGQPSQEKDSLKKQGFYVKRAWRHCRVLALQRDRYLCQDCLEKGVATIATEVHHIIPLEQRPDLALELSNLRSLCRSCHEATKLRSKPERAGIRVIKI